MQPLWKDYIVTAGNSGPYDFRIVRFDDNSNEDVVFQGRAHARPGETAVKIRINDIVADVLARRAEIVKPIIDDQPGDLEYTVPFQFRVDVLSGGTWTEKARESFMEDWSYIARNVATDPAADPITGRLDPRQWLIYTKPTTGAVSVKFIKPNGQSATVSVPQKTSYSNAFELDVLSLGGSDILYNFSSRYPTYNKIQIGTVHYAIVPPCNRYVLYYVNAFGGWDSFLVEGPAEISDGQARTVHAHEYDNADGTAAGRRVTVNELTRGYTFHTGWLTDAESSRMHHLLNATDVYVHDLEDGTVVPVVLTGSETQHKTFRSNGRQFVDYTITAQLAQERIRR